MKTKNLFQKQGIPPVDIANSSVESLSQEFDEEFGGFSPAPKFPQPVKLNLLFMMYARNPNSESGSKCLHMCTYTLQKMAQGGIHDHVGQVSKKNNIKKSIFFNYFFLIRYKINFFPFSLITKRKIYKNKIILLILGIRKVLSRWQMARAPF